MKELGISKVKEVGRSRLSFLQRFGRNQRRVALVAPASGQKKGVML
jgi:hypothetical protein